MTEHASILESHMTRFLVASENPLLLRNEKMVDGMAQNLGMIVIFSHVHRLERESG